MAKRKTGVIPASAFIDKLHSFASGLENEYFRAQALALVGLMMAKSGSSNEAKKTFEGALTCAGKIKGQMVIDSRLEAQKDILHYQAKSGFSKEAKETFTKIKNSIKAIRDPEMQIEKLEEFLISILMSGLFNEAQELAQATENIYWKSEFLHTIASAKIKAGKKEDAKKLILQAIGQLPEIKNVTDPDESFELYLQLVRIADVQIEIGSGKEAKESLLKASVALSKTRDQSEKDFLQSRISERLAGVGEIDGSLLVIGKIENKKHKLDGYRFVARACLRQGIVGRAIAKISKLDDKSSRAEALLSIALEQAKKGRRRDAYKSLGMIDPSIRKYNREYLERKLKEEKGGIRYGREERKRPSLGKPRTFRVIKPEAMSLQFIRKSLKALEETEESSAAISKATDRSSVRFNRLLNDIAIPYLGAREVKKDFDFPMLESNEQLRAEKTIGMIRRRMMGLLLILATLSAPYMVFSNMGFIGSAVSPEIALAIAFLLPIPLFIFGFLSGAIAGLVARGREGNEFGFSLSYAAAIWTVLSVMASLFLSLPESVFSDISARGTIIFIPIAYMIPSAWFMLIRRFEYTAWYKRSKPLIDKVFYALSIFSLLLLSMVVALNSPDIISSIYGTVMLLLIPALIPPLVLAGLMAYGYLKYDEQGGISMSGVEMILPFVLSPVAVILGALIGGIAFFIASLI